MQTKPVKDSSELVPVPYKFEMNEKRAILAFVKNVALQEYAVEHGAEMAFGPDIIKKVCIERNENNKAIKYNANINRIYEEALFR